MTAPLNIGVAGAAGQMGRAVISVAGARPDVAIASAFDREAMAGQSIGNLDLTTADAAIAACDVIIDFSTPVVASALAEQAAHLRRPALVIGTTGLSAEQEAGIRAASEHIAIVRSGNFSIGVNVLAGLVKQAAVRLGPDDWDIEIFEAHHRRKKDAPSGTALMLADAAARGRGVPLASVEQRARDGVSAGRGAGEIGFSVMRGGGIVGEHNVVFAAEEEIITLSHSARDRRLFARGAVQAALWVAKQAPGLYSMAHVLGFED
jgi:4-hydroxy-tetrahydrodipicolinate reductase